MRLLTWPVAALALLLAASQAPAQSLEDRVKALEMKEPVKEKAGGGGGGDKVGAYFDDGLRFKTDDGSFEGRIGAYAIIHYTSHLKYNESDGKIDTFSVKEAGVELYGRLWGAWEVYIRPRIMPGGTDLYYGWVEFNKWDCLKVRAGVFKEPFSAETLEDTKWMDLPENSVNSLLAPGRNLGAMIHGSPLDGIVNYAVGVFNGNGPGAGTDENSDKDLCVRVMLRPGAKSDSEVLKHLYIGFDYSRGVANKAVGEAPIDFRTPGTGTQFHESSTPATNFQMNGMVQRVGMDVTWIWGPLSVKAEVTTLKARGNFDDENHAFRAGAWSGQVGFWILGSTRNPNHRPDIKKALFNGGVGDVQVVGRVAQLKYNDVLEEMAGFGGTRNVDEFTLGLNYYPNAFVRVSVMYVHYQYDTRSSRVFLTANGRRFHNENALVLRAQIDF